MQQMINPVSYDKLLKILPGVISPKFLFSRYRLDKWDAVNEDLSKLIGSDDEDGLVKNYIFGWKKSAIDANNQQKKTLSWKKNWLQKPLSWFCLPALSEISILK